MVIGLIREADRAIREKMENHFVGDLTDLGYSAVSASALYGPKAFEDMGEKEVVQQLKDSGIDGVLTIVLLDKTREKNYKPVSPRQNYFWGYYSGRYNRVIRENNYYVINTKYYWESNLYALSEKDQQLVYSVQTQSFDPASAETLGHEYGKMIVKNMLDKKVLQDQKVQLK